MKILFCKSCGDLFKLSFRLKFCDCKQSNGKYLSDGDKCQISGENAVVLGIPNRDMSFVLNGSIERGEFYKFNKDYEKIIWK